MCSPNKPLWNEIKNICIDTEGAQIRTTNVKNKIKFKLNQKVNLSVSKNDSKNSQINLIPHFAIDSLKVGTIIKIGFENLELTVIKKFKNKDSILTNVSSSGYLESNKGVHINQNISLPALSEKDEFAIKIALKNQNNHQYSNTYQQKIKSPYQNVLVHQKTTNIHLMNYIDPMEYNLLYYKYHYN